MVLAESEAALAALVAGSGGAGGASISRQQVRELVHVFVFCISFF